jgi:endonuclease/exonuclease/phosphatase family metal-dependent hydrolase
MDNFTEFSLNNLSVNPKFDFIKTLFEPADNTDEEDFFGSPYDSSNISCSYLDPLEYSSRFSNLKHVSIMSFNIQSLPAKFHELKELIHMLSSSKCSPDVICLQEIWQIHENMDFSLPGYSKLEYKIRNNNVQGGGVGIYVRSHLSYSVSAIYSVFSDRLFESIFVEVTLQNSKILIGNVYRPNSGHPNLTQSEQFSQSLEIFSNIANQLSTSKIPVRIVGDFNIDVLKYNSNPQVTEYVDLLFSFGLLQVITKPTRCTQNSATLIDHVITNSMCPNIESIIVTSLISDHFPIIHHCNSSKKITKPTTIKTRNFSDENIARFNQALLNLDWSDVTECNDTQLSYNYFSDSFLSLYEIYFPVTEKKINPNYAKVEPWFSNGLLISRKNKLKLSKMASHSPTDTNILAFKTYRNLYNRTVRAGKKLYFQNELALNQSNLKRTWELIRSAANMPLVKKDGISQVSVDGELVSDPFQIATKFNEFFTSMPAKIVNEIIPPPPSSTGT